MLYTIDGCCITVLCCSPSSCCFEQLTNRRSAMCVRKGDKGRLPHTVCGHLAQCETVTVGLLTIARHGQQTGKADTLVYVHNEHGRTCVYTEHTNGSKVGDHADCVHSRVYMLVYTWCVHTYTHAPVMRMIVIDTAASANVSCIRSDTGRVTSVCRHTFNNTNISSTPTAAHAHTHQCTHTVGTHTQHKERRDHGNLYQWHTAQVENTV